MGEVRLDKGIRKSQKTVTFIRTTKTKAQITSVTGSNLWALFKFTVILKF